MANRRALDAVRIPGLRAARDREQHEREAGRRAQRVRYDARARRLVLELSNGVLIALPVDAIDAIAGFTGREVARVTLGPGGSLLVWDAADVHLSVAALLDAFAAPPEHATPGVTRTALAIPLARPR